ncbi:MAG: VOC family protein [Pseudolysinimonas sp.]
MSAILNPYLSFRGNAREAIEFYHSVFGGELNIMTFAENGDPYPGEGDSVMHAQIDTPSGFTLMASDVVKSLDYTVGVNTFSVSLSGAKSDDKELRGYWDKLSAGGQIAQPLATSDWGATFGMLTDRFGIMWLVNISAE